MDTIIPKRCLNFFFLDLFKDQYEEHGLTGVDKVVAAQFIYEVIITTNLNTYILAEKLSKYSFKNSEKTKAFLIAELIITEVFKTFQPNGQLVFLVALASYLIQNSVDASDDYKQKFQLGLEKVGPLVNSLTIAGMENLASWFAHLKTNKNLTMNWLKPLKQSEKGKFFISKILRNIMQLSNYKSLNENIGLAEYLDFFPNDPRPFCVLIDPGNQKHSDYQFLLDKFSNEISGEEMQQFIGSNELSCYGAELQDVFIQTLLDKSK